MAKKRARHTRARYEWEKTRRRTHNRATVKLSAPALRVGRAPAMPEDQPLRLDRPLRLMTRHCFLGSPSAEETGTAFYCIFTRAEIQKWDIKMRKSPF